ncbi:hypothetical protein [Streptomyces fagopyri]|uniref:hypothetical protein n=1 Tax=Streptomyces fagopyri TaxID=2662397 RepID=UPI001D17CE20|nr:hypothetical protein [Streptomyces fagopyri]
MEERRGDVGNGHVHGGAAGTAGGPPPSAARDDVRGRPGGTLHRFVSFVARVLRGEWHGMVVEPFRQLLRRGLSGLVLAFVAAFGVIFFHAIAQHPAGATVVRLTGGVKACLPLPLALLRTPVSLYVPALDLPVWAGITQLFLAFALAELALGRARTLAIAYITTLAGTLIVRVMIAMGPGWWGLGLPSRTGQVLDTGPSAAVVGLFTYLAVVRRAPVVFALTGGSMVWESVAKPNLAGREHLIAVAAAIVLGLSHGRRRRPLRALTVLLHSRRAAAGPTGTPDLRKPPAPRSLTESPAMAESSVMAESSASAESEESAVSPDPPDPPNPANRANGQRVRLR